TPPDAVRCVSARVTRRRRCPWRRALRPPIGGRSRPAPPPPPLHPSRRPSAAPSKLANPLPLIADSHIAVIARRDHLGNSGLLELQRLERRVAQLDQPGARRSRSMVIHSARLIRIVSANVSGTCRGPARRAPEPSP